MRDAPAAAMGQAWRPEPHPALRPGRVRAAFHERKLIVLAELEDDDVFTRATADNQRFWELGDTFEIFLETANPVHYAEFHVAPNSLRLQLWIKIPRPVGEPELEMVPPSFEGRAFVEPGRWTVAAAIPFEAVGGEPARFSFSRYDYTRGKSEPVHSSTSPHAVLDFHRRQDWGTLKPV